MKWIRTVKYTGRYRRSPADTKWSPPEPRGSALSERISWLERQLAHSSDIVFRPFAAEFEAEAGHKGLIVYVENMIDTSLLELMIHNGLMRREPSLPGDASILAAENGKRSALAGVRTTTSLRHAVLAVLQGQLLLLFDDQPDIRIYPLRKVETRAITESTNESVIRGPREAFVEDIDTNLTMIRRRIKHPALTTEQLTFGTYTHTKAMLVYIEGICKQELVREMKKRLGRVEIDGVLGSSYLEEYIEDNPYSPFPQLQHTERPDVVSASLLEGRIALFVDGTPIPILAPLTLPMLLQASEDYYQRFIAATWIRTLRFFFLFVTLLFPSIYIAITTFHPEMLPPTLLITVAAARETTPFPALVEAILMELSFEALREGGLRIPKAIGQTVSIIGALIIGQAAVQAGIVSAPMVIVVSMTGIASFIIPHFDLGLSLRLLRFPIMIMAGAFGLLGVVVAIILIYIHLINLRSFGTPYLSPLAPLRPEDLKDVLVRAPWWKMRTRPHLHGTASDQREAAIKLPQLPEGGWDGD
ncbi:spore germination protein [Cohnella fermenti]|uniref:spore germination protein n=1 Tax=Cohnella fermenti TaxID=2565925 RepID=UPI001E45BD94|nr:spore germination protein [Cohnella fermenti]